jgi:hypothetical protein
VIAVESDERVAHHPIHDSVAQPAPFDVLADPEAYLAVVEVQLEVSDSHG